ncbi:MAG: hypothetical protein HOO94_10350, partial [Novosphingobium sp.]|nr:hypothetical protein [Novosphingobium sp.]
ILHAKCLVHGGLASESGIEILVRGSVERLLSDDIPAVTYPQAKPVRTDDVRLRA